MGYILDSLRAEFDEESTTNFFGIKRYPKARKGDGMLYLSARMRDAENEAKRAKELAYATEQAAIDLLGRYDGDGSLIREFKQQIEIRKGHL
jgi:hypothetical protein